jgi:hypothetical protein
MKKENKTEASLDAIVEIVENADWKAGPPKPVRSLLLFMNLLLQCCKATMDGKSAEAIKIQNQLTQMRIDKEIPEAELTSLFSKLLHKHAQIPKTIGVRITHLSAKIAEDPRAMAVRIMGIVSGIKEKLPEALIGDLQLPDLKRLISQALQPPISKSLFFKPKHEHTPMGKLEKQLQEYLKFLHDAARQSPQVVPHEKPEGHYRKPTGHN